MTDFKVGDVVECIDNGGVEDSLTYGKKYKIAIDLNTEISVYDDIYGTFRKNRFKLVDKEKADKINHPSHYTSHKSGIECIAIVEHMQFNLGNAIKYIWQHEEKNGIEDLKKAVWYIQREIALQERLKNV